MNTLLTIISITKDDPVGISSTLQSAEILRSEKNVTQMIVDSSSPEKRETVETLVNSTNAAYVHQEPKGISAAFNCGIAKSTGEWLWFLNGGDLVHPDIEPDKFLYLLEASNADMIVFQIERIQSKRRQNHPAMWELWPLTFNWIPHPSTLVRRSLFEKYGSFDEKYKAAMDLDLWFRLIKNHVVVDMISIPIACYDETGLSCTNRVVTGRESRDIILKNLQKIASMVFYSYIGLFMAIRTFHKECRR